jgi:PAS domain-containing protein
MEHFPGTATIKDNKDCYLYYNHVFAEILGIGREEWIGKSIEEIFPFKVASKVKAKDLKVISEGFDGYISKPIVIKRLKETLDDLLE